MSKLLSKKEEQDLNRLFMNLPLGEIMRRLVNSIEGMQAITEELDKDTGVSSISFNEKFKSEKYSKFSSNFLIR